MWRELWAVKSSLRDSAIFAWNRLSLVIARFYGIIKTLHFHYCEILRNHKKGVLFSSLRDLMKSSRGNPKSILKSLDSAESLESLRILWNLFAILRFVVYLCKMDCFGFASQRR